MCGSAAGKRNLTLDGVTSPSRQDIAMSESKPIILCSPLILERTSGLVDVFRRPGAAAC